MSTLEKLSENVNLQYGIQYFKCNIKYGLMDIEIVGTEVHLCVAVCKDVFTVKYHGIERGDASFITFDLLVHLHHLRKELKN